ncbi:MAG: creatininase family protein [Methanolinea sp.]|nr:creatininase family protein [Methanolinea sp.]
MEKNPLLVQHLTAADYSKRPFSTVILPLGSLESHGPHLPLGTDTLTAYEIALEVAAHVPGTAVLPPLNYGMSEHYRDFPFTVSLKPETETAVIRDILESLYREGIRHVFLMNGHDGNIPSLEIAAREVKVAHPDLVIVGLDAWWNTIGDLLPENFFEVERGLGHGGEGELSIALALFPGLCRPEDARGVVPSLPPHLDVKWLFSEITNTGASGDPTKASREKGLFMKEVLVNAIVKALQELDACGWDLRSAEVRGGRHVP